MSDPRITPAKLHLKKDEKLEIHWQDGVVSIYPILYLRKNCPCAGCKTLREEEASKPKTRLTVLGKVPKSDPILATSAKLVGGYAMQIDWSDDHNSGIYSFAYLRDIDPTTPECFRPRS